eukprot:11432858-Heterocapsa_arctica.AAC.1
MCRGRLRLLRRWPMRRHGIPQYKDFPLVAAQRIWYRRDFSPAKSTCQFRANQRLGERAAPSG